ncbi:MAG TPA: hypothetical protein VIJ54_04625 [Actinomycetes bacterium]
MSSELELTRRSLHAVAETLLAWPQSRITGTIRLYAAPGGFTTGPLGDPVSRVAVRGTDLVVTGAGGERVVPLRGTLGEVAAAAGIDLGGPVGVYESAAHPAPSDVVRIDAAAASVIARAFTLGDEACGALGAAHQPSDPPVPVLWPEHFDVGVALDDVNYGVSAGDASIPEPYAYVGPHQARRGDFWDQPFGSARPVRELAGVADLVAYFEEGLTRARLDPPVGGPR